jgi:hypothetical protein
MKLKELKKFINSIPESFDDYTVVNGEIGYYDEEKGVIMVNKPILTVYVDRETNEIQLLHQTEEEVKKIMRNGHTKND